MPNAQAISEIQVATVTLKGVIKANISKINIHEVMTMYSRKIGTNFCRAYKVNCFEKLVGS